MKIKKLLNILETDELISLISLILFLIIISFLEIIGISLVPILFSAVIGGEFFIYKIDINFINKFIQSNTQSDLVLYISIFIIFFYFMKNLIFAYSIYFQGKIIKNIKISFSKKLLEFYISQNYLYLLEKNSPVLLRTLTSDLGNSAICILHIVNLLRDFLILFGITTFLFLANPVVSLFLFILFSIAVFSFYNFNKKNFFYRSKIIQSLSSDIIKSILEIVGLFKDIKIYNLEKFQEIAYEKKVILNENQILKNYFITSIPKLFLEFIGVASIVLIVIFFKPIYLVH
jgi:ABC-type multidrug transport system fused ATPase/permease subunit